MRKKFEYQKSKKHLKTQNLRKTPGWVGLKKFFVNPKLSISTYLDIIKSDHAGRIHRSVVGSGLLGVGLHALNQLPGERRV